jgi:hypothetical protein
VQFARSLIKAVSAKGVDVSGFKKPADAALYEHYLDTAEIQQYNEYLKSRGT